MSAAKDPCAYFSSFRAPLSTVMWHYESVQHRHCAIAHLHFHHHDCLRTGFFSRRASCLFTPVSGLGSDSHNPPICLPGHQCQPCMVWAWVPMPIAQTVETNGHQAER